MADEESQEYLERRLTLEVEAREIADSIKKNPHSKDRGFFLIWAETGNEDLNHFASISSLERESSIQMLKVLLEKWGTNQ